MSNDLLKEQEANAFAMALLMPENMVLQQINKNKKLYLKRGREWLIKKLAWKFQVSEQAMIARLYDLGIINEL